MMVGEAYKAKLLTHDMLDAVVSANLADPSAPTVLEFGGSSPRRCRGCAGAPVGGGGVGSASRDWNSAAECDHGASAQRDLHRDPTGESRVRHIPLHPYPSGHKRAADCQRT